MNKAGGRLESRGRRPAEPEADEFFVSDGSICVYVNLRGHPVRVRFDAPDGDAVATATVNKELAKEAIALATSARERNRRLLQSLFGRVSRLPRE